MDCPQRRGGKASFLLTESAWVDDWWMRGIAADAVPGCGGAAAAPDKFKRGGPVCKRSAEGFAVGRAQQRRRLFSASGRTYVAFRNACFASMLPSSAISDLPALWALAWAAESLVPGVAWMTFTLRVGSGPPRLFVGRTAAGLP
jgi:hypothetical protein